MKCDEPSRPRGTSNVAIHPDDDVVTDVEKSSGDELNSELLATDDSERKF